MRRDPSEMPRHGRHNHKWQDERNESPATSLTGHLGKVRLSEGKSLCLIAGKTNEATKKTQRLRIGETSKSSPVRATFKVGVACGKPWGYPYGATFTRAA